MTVNFEVTEELLQEIVRRIVDECDPEKIILFGSRARDNARPDSDVDVLVIERDPFGKERSRYRELVRLNKAMGRIPVPIDILAYSTDEIEFWRDSINHVVPHALHEGRTIYERS